MFKVIAAILEKVICEQPHALYFEIFRGVASTFSTSVFIFSFPLFFFEVVGVTTGVEMGIISDDCFRVVQFHIPTCSSFDYLERN